MPSAHAHDGDRFPVHEGPQHAAAVKAGELGRTSDWLIADHDPRHGVATGRLHHPLPEPVDAITAHDVVGYAAVSQQGDGTGAMGAPAEGVDGHGGVLHHPYDRGGPPNDSPGDARAREPSRRSRGLMAQ